MVVLGVEGKSAGRQQIFLDTLLGFADYCCHQVQAWPIRCFDYYCYNNYDNELTSVNGLSKCQQWP